MDVVTAFLSKPKARLLTVHYEEDGIPLERNFESQKEFNTFVKSLNWKRYCGDKITILAYSGS